MRKDFSIDLTGLVVYGVQEVQIAGDHIDYIEFKNINACESIDEAREVIISEIKIMQKTLENYELEIIESNNQYRINVAAKIPFSIIYNIVKVYF